MTATRIRGATIESDKRINHVSKLARELVIRREQRETGKKKLKAQDHSPIDRARFREKNFNKDWGNQERTLPAVCSKKIDWERALQRGERSGAQIVGSQSLTHFMTSFGSSRGKKKKQKTKWVGGWKSYQKQWGGRLLGLHEKKKSNKTCIVIREVRRLCVSLNGVFRKKQDQKKFSKKKGVPGRGERGRMVKSDFDVREKYTTLHRWGAGEGRMAVRKREGDAR